MRRLLTTVLQTVCVCACQVFQADGTFSVTGSMYNPIRYGTVALTLPNGRALVVSGTCKMLAWHIMLDRTPGAHLH